MRDAISPEHLAQKMKELVDAGDSSAIKHVYDRFDGKPVETVNQTLVNLPEVVEIDLTE